jgi:hypothetical protein
MTDIVERLLAHDRRHPGISHLCHPLELLDEAADEIERWRNNADNAQVQIDDQKREIERLREVLEFFAKAADCFDGMPIKDPSNWFAYGGTSSADGTTGAITVAHLRAARKALKGEP